jgi:hypothetical protein
MSDEEILSGLRRTALEEERRYEAWAARRGAEGREAPHHDIDAIVARSLASLDGGCAPVTPIAARPQRRFVRAAPWIGALAAAAALLLVLGRPGRTTELPQYVAEVAYGAERPSRGLETARTPPLVLRPGGAFELVLRPATRAEGPLAVRAALLSGSAPVAMALPMEVTVNEAGVARARGLWPASPPADTQGLSVTLCRPGDVPADPATSPSERCRVLRIAVVPPSP